MPFWRTAWNFCHQWSGITWLFQRCVIIPSLFVFTSQNFYFAVNCTTEFLELFSDIMSITASLLNTNTLISSSVPSCYVLWVTWLHRDRVGGRGWWQRHMPTSQLKSGIFPIQLQVITPPVKPVGAEPWVVISAINFLVCGVYLCYPPWQVSLLSRSPWHSAGTTRLLCDAVYKEWQIKMTGLSYKIGI